MPTTIQVKEKTRDRLQYFKQNQKESYDEILNKLMNEVEEGELSNVALEGVIRGTRDVQEGRIKSIQEVAKKFRMKLEE